MTNAHVPTNQWTSDKHALLRSWGYDVTTEAADEIERLRAALRGLMPDGRVDDACICERGKANPACPHTSPHEPSSYRKALESIEAAYIDLDLQPAAHEMVRIARAALRGAVTTPDEDIAYCASCGDRLEAVRPGKFQHVGPCIPVSPVNGTKRQ